MVRIVKRLALAGAFLMVAAPAFAQVPPQVNPLGIDLDPFHLFTPATPAAAPMAEPAMARPMMQRRMMRRPMMRKPMMRKSMMMKKPMMRKPMMKKSMMKKPMMKSDAK